MKKFMHNYALVAFCLSICFFEYGDYWANSWHAKWAFLMGVGSIAWAFMVGRRLSSLFIPALIWTTISGVRIFSWRYTEFFHPIPLNMFETLQESSAHTWASFFLICSLMAMSPRWVTAQIPKALAVIGWVSVYKTLLEFTWTAFQRGGLMGNASMNGCLIVALAPFMMVTAPSGLFYPSAAVILLAFGMIHKFFPAVCLLAVMWNIWRIKRERHAWTALPFLIGGALGVIHWEGGSGRWGIWTEALQSVWHQGEIWRGLGLGNTARMLVNLQQLLSNGDINHNGQIFQIPRFFFMHSDIIQVVYEMGLIGAVCWIIAWVSVWPRVKDTIILSSSFCAWTAYLTFNYPVHMPISALCLAMTVTYAIRQRGGGRVHSPLDQRNSDCSTFRLGSFSDCLRSRTRSSPVRSHTS